MVEYFRDFRELHRNHENFLTPPLSTGLQASKSRSNDESRKSAKIMKIFNHENLDLYGITPLAIHALRGGHTHTNERTNKCF